MWINKDDAPVSVATTQEVRVLSHVRSPRPEAKGEYYPEHRIQKKSCMKFLISRNLQTLCIFICILTCIKTSSQLLNAPIRIESDLVWLNSLEGITYEN